MDLSETQLDPFATLSEAENLLSNITSDLEEHLVLIGGQALLLWAEHYLINPEDGYQYDFLASDDLDLMGRRPAVEACAQAWGGTAVFPSPDDQTPNSGIVYLDDTGGLSRTVDFLSNVHGISEVEVKKYSDLMVFGKRKVKVLSPPLCLKSRIHNLHSLNYGEVKKARELKRIRAAIEVSNWYLLDSINQKDVRVLANAVKYLMRQVLLSREALMVSAEHQLNLMEVFPIKAIQGFCPNISDKYLAIWGAKYQDSVSKRFAARPQSNNQ